MMAFFIFISPEIWCCQPPLSAGVVMYNSQLSTLVLRGDNSLYTTDTGSKQGAKIDKDGFH